MRDYIVKAKVFGKEFQFERNAPRPEFIWPNMIDDQSVMVTRVRMNSEEPDESGNYLYTVDLTLCGRTFSGEILAMSQSSATTLALRRGVLFVEVIDRNPGKPTVVPIAKEKT